MNKKTVALDQQQYKTIISTIRSGFVWNNHSFKPNERLATILVLQANLGLRISDILQLQYLRAHHQRHMDEYYAF